jgi:hypothetical protein
MLCISNQVDRVGEGHRYFLLRGFNKVRGEWSLMALCYNFTRVLNILGLIAYMAAKIFAAFQRADALAAISNRIQATAGPFWRTLPLRSRFAEHNSPWLADPSSCAASTGKSAKAVQPFSQKIFCLACRANQFYQLAPSFPGKRGGSRVVTNAGWDAVDAAASARSAIAGRVILAS